MSETSINAFMKAVGENEDIRDAVDSAMVAAVVGVAKDRGFDFTIQDYLDASSELGDGELEGVAGGVGTEPTPIYRGALSRINNLIERQGFEDPLTAFPKR